MEGDSDALSIISTVNIHLTRPNMVWRTDDDNHASGFLSLISRSQGFALNWTSKEGMQEGIYNYLKIRYLSEIY